MKVYFEIPKPIIGVIYRVGNSYRLDLPPFLRTSLEKETIFRLELKHSFAFQTVQFSA